MLYSMERPFYNAAFNKINIGKIMSLRFRLSVLCTALALAVAAAPPAFAAKKAPAETPTAASDSSADSAKEQLLNDIQQRAQSGPKVIDLGMQGKLKLPKGMVFIGRDDANLLMQMGETAKTPTATVWCYPSRMMRIGWSI